MKTESQEAYYNRKIEECSRAEQSSMKGDKQEFYKRELANYQQALYNYLSQSTQEK